LDPKCGSRSITSCTRWNRSRSFLHPDDQRPYVIVPLPQSAGRAGCRIGPAVMSTGDQPGIHERANPGDDVLVFGEERIVVRIIQAMRVLRCLTAASSIRRSLITPDHSDPAGAREDGNGGQNLQRGRVSAAGHHQRPVAPGRCSPLPDTDSFVQCTTAWSMVSHCGRAVLARQPLR